jgi:polyisoprenoid-binding protein YceI
MKTILILFLTLTFSIFSQNYTLSKSNIEFQVDTRFGKANGKFSNTQIQIKDPKNFIGTVTVPINTINTGNSLRDKHLKSDDFFDIEKFPNSIFQVVSVSKKGEKNELKGLLTIKGITKEISFPIDIKENEDKLVITGNFLINREEFQINYNSIMNPIEKNVTILFEINLQSKEDK